MEFGEMKPGDERFMPPELRAKYEAEKNGAAEAVAESDVAAEEGMATDADNEQKDPNYLPTALEVAMSRADKLIAKDKAAAEAPKTAAPGISEEVKLPTALKVAMKRSDELVRQGGGKDKSNSKRGGKFSRLAGATAEIAKRLAVETGAGAKEVFSMVKSNRERNKSAGIREKKAALDQDIVKMQEYLKTLEKQAETIERTLSGEVSEDSKKRMSSERERFARKIAKAKTKSGKYAQALAGIVVRGEKYERGADKIFGRLGVKYEPTGATPERTYESLAKFSSEVEAKIKEQEKNIAAMRSQKASLNAEWKKASSHAVEVSIERERDRLDNQIKKEEANLKIYQKRAARLKQRVADLGSIYAGK